MLSPLRRERGGAAGGASGGRCVPGARGASAPPLRDAGRSSVAIIGPQIFVPSSGPTCGPRCPRLNRVHTSCPPQGLWCPRAAVPAVAPPQRAAPGGRAFSAPSPLAVMAALLLLLLQLLACCRRSSAASPVRLQPSPLRVSCPGPHGQVFQRQDDEHRVSCLWNSTVTLHYQPAPGAGLEVEGEEGQPPSPPCCLWYLNAASLRNISRWSGQVVLQTEAPSPGASSLLTVQCSSASCAAPGCFHRNVSVEIAEQDMRLFVLWPQTRVIQVWQPVELGWCARLKSAGWQYRFSSRGGVPSTLLLPSSEHQDTASPAVYPAAELQQTCATYYSYRLTVRYRHPGIHVALVSVEQMPHISLNLSLKVEPDLVRVLSISSKLLSVPQQPLSLSWWLQPLTLSTLAYRLVDTQAIGGWLCSYSPFTLPSNFCAISTPQSLDEIVVASVYFHVDGKRFEELMGELHLLNGTLSLTAGKETPIHVNLSPGKTNSSTHIFRYNQGTFYTSKDNNSTFSTDRPNTHTVFYQYKELSYLLTIEFLALQWYKFKMYLYMNQKRALIRSLAERDLDIHVFSSGRPSFLQKFSYLVWFIPAQHPMLQCEWTFYLQLFGTKKDHIVQTSTYTYNDHVKNATRFVRRSALPFDAEKYTGFVAKVNCTSSAPTPALLSVRVNNSTAKTIEAPVVCEKKECRISTCWIDRPDDRTRVLYKKRALEFFLFVRLDVDCHVGISIKPLWHVYPAKDLKTEPDWSKPVNTSGMFGVKMIHLTVPANYLDYGLYLFYFAVEVVPIRTSIVLKEYDMIYVQIERADLLVNILGGSVRTVGFSERWTLDGSGSSDPDSQEGQLIYTWYCTKDPADYRTMKFKWKNRCHPSQKDLRWITPSGPIQTIPPESLPGNTLYYFRLVIQKGRRTAYADQVVEIDPGPPLILDVKCLENCGSSLIPTERFALSGKCSNCKPSNKPLYYWSLFSDTSQEINFDWSSKTSTGRSGAYLSIHALTFTKPAYQSYVLHLSVTTWDGRSSSFRKPFSVNTPPQAGRCNIRPRYGFAFQTKFVVRCRGFSDSHLPLTYKVIVASNVPQTTTVTSVVENTFGTILYFGSEPKTPPSLLPLGLPSRWYRLTLYVQIRDSFGSFTQVSLRAYVRRPPRTQSLSGVFHELLVSAGRLSMSTSAEQIGDRLRAGYLVYLAASLLNYIKNTPIVQLPQAQLRETVVKTALNISVNSIMEVNQVVAVISEVTESVEKMNVRSQDLAIGKLTEVTGILKRQRSQIHWSEGAEIQTTGILRCLSNVLRADLLHLKNVSADGIQHVFSIMEGVTDVIFWGKVPEEIETLIETGHWNITLKKNEAWDIKNYFPATDTCHNCFYPMVGKGNGGGVAPDTVFSTAIFEFDESPFPWLGYTSDIISMVMGFKIAESKTNGDLVPITPERADFFLARKGGVATFYLVMGPDKTETYTTGGFHFEINETATSMYFQIMTKLKVTFKVLIFTGTNLTDAQLVASFAAFHNMPTVATGNKTIIEECSVEGPYIVCLPKSLLTIIVQQSGVDAQNISVVLQTDYILRYPNQRVVSIYIFNDQCLFLNGVGSEWSKDPCVIGPLTNWEKVHCICVSMRRRRSVAALPAPSIKFLAAKVVVLPNAVDLGRNLIADIPKNPLTLITVLCIFVIYLLLCCWAIRRDRIEKEIKYIIVLPDNEASDEGSFLVTLYTGSRWNAGTKAEVFLQLIGQYGRSKFRCLWHQPSPAFQRGSIDCFLITTTKNLGDIRSFKIRLNNDSISPTWFLSRAEIEDMSTRKVWFFLCRKWLFLDKNNPSHAWKFSVTDPQIPLPKFDYFLINFNRRLTEYHLWLSIFAPVIAGGFTRFQRLSTFLAVILFTLLVNIMFFNADKNDEAPVYLRYLRSIAVGIECALLTLPVEMLLIALFKYSQKDPPPVVTKMYPKVDSRYWNNCIISEKDANVIETPEQMTPVNSPQMGRRSQKSSSNVMEGGIFSKVRRLSTTIRQLRKIPDTEPLLWWWCVPVAWGLVLTITVLSSFFIVLYGLSYGYQTSREWLIASGTSFLQNVCFNSILKSLLFSAMSTIRPRYFEDIRWVTQEKHVEINSAEETHSRIRPRKSEDTKQVTQEKDVEINSAEETQRDET
ncbi:polycystic kidney disease and receptor for egg jelly-related protein [Motacilla alba alba]|uniref:polycystic kidney disease and receptor for egg jelly-related protein n=1 Tax=Motacilla alba alba TaxID=1094192 RepID=UPI0018D55B35|nr:polycystic kidney disease and receptor for egg jelly-related protein [Motacilla alba alba]